MDDLAVHTIMGEALISHGHLTAEQVAADRAAIEEGTPPAGAAPVAPTPSVEPATPQAPAVETGFEGGETPASYQFERMAGVQSDPQTELALRTFFHAEGIPVPIAKQMNTMFTKAALSPPNDAQLSASKQTAMAALSKQWGAETEKNLAAANREVDRMEKGLPGLKAQLLATGLGNSPWLISTIFNIAQAKGRAS